MTLIVLFNLKDETSAIKSPAPFQYVEILEVNDMEQLGKDISTDMMKSIAAQFQDFADNPTFMMAGQIA